MKIMTIAIMFLTIMLITATDADAQSRADAPILLAKASHAQMIEGDLDRAASLYEQVATSPTARRSDVAVALVKLGNTYALQGSADAVPVYERVVSEFSDQPESFMAANAKLTVLYASASASSESGARKSGANYAIVSEEMANSQLVTPRTYDFSPDGTKLLIVLEPTGERKKLFPNLRTEAYLRDTNGSVGQPLIKDAEDWEYINMVRWSPNGRYVFYVRSKFMSREDGERQLMLLDVETQESRQLKGDFEKLAPSLQYGGVEWMPDNTGLMLQTRHDFHLVSLDGVLRKDFLGEVGHMSALGQVSPDGRFMLYHKISANKEDRNEMDIWKLDLDNGESTELTNYEGYEGWPVWSADGKQIYYVSGPQASRNVYRLKPGSNQLPVKITNYSNASAMYPKISQKGAQLSFALIKDNHLVFAADSNNMESANTVVRGDNAMLSPDGLTVYYTDMQPGRVGLWRVGVNGDSPKQMVSGKILTSYGPVKLLSPDGSQIAYSQYTGDTTTLFMMPSSGGKAVKLYSADGVRHLIPSWSPDSKEIAFSIDGSLMVIPVNGGDAKVLAVVKNWESWNLEWSPDGRSIAGFAYLEGEKENHIMVVDRASKKLTRVTPKSEGQYKEILAWHPSGKRISYMYYNTENHNGSRVVDLETSKITDLVDMPDPNWDYIGIWGPDKRYYFASVPRGFGLWGLYAVTEGERDYQQIRKVPGASVSLPSWNADGSRMVWSEETPVRQIWMMTNYE